MSDGTAIEWTDATWNPITGCSVVSPGCTNCYAMRLAGTRLRHHPTRIGLTRDTKAGPVWTGDVRFNERVLTEPLRWTKTRRIFVGAHGDLFHENVPDEWIDRVFAVMALCPQHTFQVLTKRSARMRHYVGFMANRDDLVAQAARMMGASEGAARHAQALARSPLPNVWLGVSAEDQPRADERIPDLLATPAAVRWVSAEPLLGPIAFREIGGPNGNGFNAFDDGADEGVKAEPILDWIVVGGESGPHARPMHPQWARDIRDQCVAAGVPFFFKQWGEFLSGAQWLSDDVPAEDRNALYRVGKRQAGRMLDGVTHDAMPAAR